MSRRKLLPKQQVIIVYDKEIGFTNESAEFIEYRFVFAEGIKHYIPFFKYQNKEISGLDCFWLLPQDIKSEKDIEKYQYEIIKLQIEVLAIANTDKLSIPIKVKDKEIIKMAQDKSDKLQALIQKLGYDPRDESWIETELVGSVNEKNWFQFERENPIVFMEKWDEMVFKFNRKYNANITKDDAKKMSKKRMRYILGAHYTRLSGNSNKADWKKAARDFEEKHREIEERMMQWTLSHKDDFPLVKVKEPVQFWTGPHFNTCFEKVPHLFTDINLTHIKKGIVLRIIQYDPVTRYIRLDFTPEIRQMILGTTSEPWLKESSEYEFIVHPTDIDKNLEILGKIV